jgi:hypothetical protein
MASTGKEMVELTAGKQNDLSRQKMVFGNECFLSQTESSSASKILTNLESTHQAQPGIEDVVGTADTKTWQLVVESDNELYEVVTAFLLGTVPSGKY